MIMKKIKFLNGLVIILIIIYVLHFVTNIYLTFFTPHFMNFSDEFYKKFIFGYYTQFVGLIFSVITFIGLFFIQQGLKTTIKEGFFNKKSSFKFKTGGQLFLISGVLSLVFDLSLVYYSVSISLFESLGQDFLLIMVGFGLFVFADVIQNGNILKQENELTI